MPADHDVPPRSGLGGWDVVLACLAIAVAAAAVAGFAWARPKVAPASLAYTQSGHLSYTAPVGPTSVYGSTQVRSGQPVYTDVVTTLSITYDYRFGSTAPAAIAGTEQLVATMSNGQGITRTIPLQAPTTFSGDQFTTSANLSIAALQATAASFSGAAGGRNQAVSGSTYAVAISPTVSVHGRLGHAAVHASFGKTVTFSYSATALTPSATAGTGLPGSAPGQATGSATLRDRLTSSSSGSVRLPGGQAATLFGLPVSDLRVVSLIVVVIALAAAAAVGWPLLRDATSDDERRRIVARHGPALVEVNGLPAGPGVLIVNLASFEGLLQVAQRLECPVLHTGAGTHAYGVVDNGTLYRYGTRLARQPVANVLVTTNGARHAPEAPGGEGRSSSEINVR